jgi:sulfur-oxidizing protein SoxX
MMSRHELAAAALLAMLVAPVLAEMTPGEAAGRALAIDMAKGNCLACHLVPGDPQAVTSANIGPPLVGIRSRFPQRERLRDQVSDPMRFNPDTVMPPFGKHRILTDAEIDRIVDYLYTL